jgi:hypothetical protein
MRPRVFACFYNVGAGPGVISNYWLEPLTRSLRDEMGCDTVIPNSVNLGAAYGRSDPAWMRDQRPRHSEALLEEFRAAHRERPIDLFLSLFSSSQIEPAALREIRGLGVPCVNFFCDNLHAFNVVEEIAAEFTLNWVAERRACDIYRRRGLPYIYLPMAACPTYHRPVPVASEDIDVSFCGSFQNARVELFGEALDRGLEVEVFGPQTDRFAPDRVPWLRRTLTAAKSHAGNLLRRGVAYELHALRMEAALRRHGNYPQRLLHQPLPDDEVIRLYARSKVTLGVNRIWLPGTLGLRRTPWYSYPRLRDFEATMSGACYLTEYAEEHDDLFEIGEEIEVYRDSAELVDKAKRLLADPERRRQLRDKARRAALARHSWRHRLEKIFQAIGVKIPADAHTLNG